MKSLHTWTGILVVVLTSTFGDIYISKAMKQIGDLGNLRRSKGLVHVVGRVLRSGSFLLGLLCLSLSFFSLLFSLSWGDVSLIGPASASLTFIANAFVAGIFLRERVDRRRWTAAVLVAVGVALMAA
jgi:multidrug transporter EmrE-like cation transporter